MSDTKQFVFGDSESGQSVVTLEHDGNYHDPDEGFPRPVYRYRITTDRWEFENNDIRGDQGEQSNLDLAAKSLFYFLWECVRTENNEFPANVRAWASRYTDEFEELASGTPEPNPVMIMHNGVLLDSDEDGVEF